MNEQRPSKEQFYHPSVPAALRRAGEELDFIAAGALEAQADEIERLQQRVAELEHSFKNFHRLLCERFNYVHDEKDWQRDQLSLIEHIAQRASQPPTGFRIGDCVINYRGRKGVLHSVSMVQVRWQDGGMTSVPSSSLERRDYEEADREIAPAVTKPAPVDGVVAGSNLERQIQMAQVAISGWPADVRKAMGVEDEGECAHLPTQAAWCPKCTPGETSVTPTDPDEETPCPIRDDGLHCECWYGGEKCCGCGHGAILNGQAWPTCADVRAESETPSP